MTTIRILAALLASAALAACASPGPRKLRGDEDFAVLYTPPVKCVAIGACVARVNIKAINGVATQNLVSQYNYQVEPGEVSVLVLSHPVLGDKLPWVQGVCELKWTAVAGEIYALDRTVAPNGFNVTAKRGGDVVASCFAAFA